MDQVIRGVFLSEFNIERGTEVVCKYPKDLSLPENIADKLIPDGAHKHSQDWIFTTFDPKHEKLIKTSANQADSGLVPDFSSNNIFDGAGYIFKKDTDRWEIIGGESTRQTVRLSRGKALAVSVHRIGEVSALGVFELLPGTQAKRLRAKFQVVETRQGRVGLSFRTEEDEYRFAEAIKQASTARDREASPATRMYMLSLTQTLRSARAKRGIFVKSLGIVSTERYIEAFAPILDVVLQRLLFADTLTLDDVDADTAQSLALLHQQKSVESLFKTLNAPSVPLPALPLFSESELRYRVAANDFGKAVFAPAFTVAPDSSLRQAALGLESAPINACLLGGQVLTAHPIFLVALFREAAMAIFNAALLERSVLFSGDSMAGPLVSLAFATPLLCSAQPMFGRVRSNLSMRDIHSILRGTIYSSTNPMVEARSKWDVLARARDARVFVARGAFQDDSDAAVAFDVDAASAGAAPPLSKAARAEPIAPRAQYDADGLIAPNPRGLYSDTRGLPMKPVLQRDLQFYETVLKEADEELLDAVRGSFLQALRGKAPTPVEEHRDGAEAVLPEISIEARFLPRVELTAAEAALSHRVGVCFREYTQQLYMEALGLSDGLGAPGGAGAGSEAVRLSAVRATDTWKQWREATMRERAKNSPAYTLLNDLRRLRYTTGLSVESVGAILRRLDAHLKTIDDLRSLLGCLPLATGGITPIAICLFHPTESVRLSAVSLLHKIDSTSIGSKFVENLNYFLILAYERLKQNLIVNKSRE